MEIMQGKQTLFIDASALTGRLNKYKTVHLDIGTGDGRFVQHVARTYPNIFVIGIDACRENLFETSRCAAENALFAIANARVLPSELYGLASQITINFPWGSLLEGLLTEDSAVLAGLVRCARPDARLDVRLNAGALAEVGWSLEEAAAHIRRNLAANGFAVRSAAALTISDLKSYPTTWAKRLAYGRDPRGMYLSGSRSE